jgi:GH18 family chitinase
VNDPNSRQAFIKNIALVYDQFHLDGIDIDWEYPAQRGDPRNYVGSNDTANFLEFLRSLRATLPRTARISAAVQTTPFIDATGQPMKDVQPFADILDWIVIMNYDIWGGVFCIIPSFSTIPSMRLQLRTTLDRTHLLATLVETLHNQWLMPRLR